MVVTLVLLVMLALQICMIFMFFAEKRFNNIRHQAMKEYVDNYVEDVATSLETQIAEEKADTMFKTETALKNLNDEIIQHLADVTQKCETLEMDYSQAQDAARRINDFGSSLASIFDYDPMKAIQKGRTKEAS